MKESKQNLQTRYQKNRMKMMVIAIGVNIVIAIVFMFSFYSVMKNMRQQASAGYEFSNHNRIKGMVMQFEGSLNSQNGIIHGYSTYISGEQLSLPETIAYLSYWSDFYGEIALVPMNGETAYELFPGEKEATETVVSESEGILAIQQEIQTNGFANHFTKPYEMVNGGLGIGIYAPVTVEGLPYALVFANTIDSLRESSMKVDGMDNARGFFLDENDQIISGAAVNGAESSVGENYLTILSGLAGEEAAKEALEKAKTEAVAFLSYELTSGEREDIFVQKLEGANWLYVYRCDPKSFDMGNNAGVVKATIFTIAFFTVWIILIVVTYTLYSRGLRHLLNVVAEQNDQLQHASDAKTSFVSNMSHEIRTPINAVLGMNEMILRESKEENVLGYAADIQRSGKTLLGIINDVLDFSKIESDKLEIILSEYSLQEIIKDLYRMIAVRAKDKQLTFEVQVAEDIPTLLIGDDVRVKQILMNLLTNAVKYTEKGTIRLLVEKRDTEEDNTTDIFVSVTDTGIGMHKEEMDKLFTPYERLDEKRNRTIEGTGLGLALVTRLLTMMGSKLDVESEYGKGSTFSFTLRQEVKDETPIGKFDYNLRDTAKVYKSVLFAPKASVLVVDDVSLNLKVVTGLLKNSGMRVDTADSGEKTLAMTKSRKYDIIFLDHRMPGMDGIETLHALKEQGGPNTTTPVIALTANVVSGAKESYQQEGFSDFLPKPIDSEHLEKAIMDYLPANLLEDKDAPAKEPVKEEKHKLNLEQVMDPENIRIAQEKIAANKAKEEAERLEREAKEKEEAERLAAEEAKKKPVRVASVIKQPAPVRMSIRDALKETTTREEELVSYEDYEEEITYEPQTELESKSIAIPAEIDINEAIRYCGSEEMVSIIMETFKDDVPPMVVALYDALTAGDVESFTLHAHSIKSSARTIGAKDLAEEARILEVMGKAGNIFTAREKVERLEKHVRDLCNQLP